MHRQFRRQRAQTTQHQIAPDQMPLDARASTGVVVSPYELRKRSEPRSAELLAVLREIDTAVDQLARTEIMRWVREEYDARQGGILIGLFQKCHLGPPYIDHKLDLFGNIVHHYTRDDTVEHPYGQARGLVSHGAYLYVEVYADGATVPIRTDGTAVTL